MSEINIPIHAMIYCCGWETQILHTTFSYVFSYMSNGMRCGNTIARWYFNMSSDIYSCVPPTIYYIQTESEKVQFFVNVFFFHKTGIQSSKKLKHIPAASVLKPHDAFIGIIKNEPSGKYKDPSHQYFHHKTIYVLSEIYISDQTFKKYKEEVTDGFNAKHWLGVNISIIRSGSYKRYDDICCFKIVIYKQESILGESFRLCRVLQKK